jgi:hypothetical protein
VEAFQCLSERKEFRLDKEFAFAKNFERKAFHRIEFRRHANPRDYGLRELVRGVHYAMEAVEMADATGSFRHEVTALISAVDEQRVHRNGAACEQGEQVFKACADPSIPRQRLGIGALNLGYRSAGKYINGEYVTGAAQLLAMLLASPDVDPASLLLIAKRVMPNGNSAFLQKAEVPTYFVGSETELERLYKLAPAPSETYTTLLWLGDTSGVDSYLKARKQAETKKPS